jgi:hypothetical protein
MYLSIAELVKGNLSEQPFERLSTEKVATEGTTERRSNTNVVPLSSFEPSHSTLLEIAELITSAS